MSTICKSYISVTEGPSLSGSPSDNTLPVVFETTEDSSLNNQSRADVNCDKTGTCYDGKWYLVYTYIKYVV